MNNCLSQSQACGIGYQSTADTVGDIVIALHCSGGNSKQWRSLSNALDPKHELLTPEHYGTAPDLIWREERPFTLADEAAASLRLIDQTDRKVHLVGHSYGGALALHIAQARPQCIASISLYEPCAFHLLRQLGPAAQTALEEIQTIASGVRLHYLQGDYWSAMQDFVDYWNGEGFWLAMKPEYRDMLMSWAASANHGFDALFNEPAPLHSYRELQIPVRLLQGACSPHPVQAISSGLKRLLPDCQIDRLAGVGHMGPLTHADRIAQIISAHIASHSSTAGYTFNGTNSLVELVNEAA